jgi:hypothetical protein
MKTLKIKEKTHHKLNLYKVKNKLKTLDEAINKLLRGVKDGTTK